MTFKRFYVLGIKMLFKKKHWQKTLFKKKCYQKFTYFIFIKRFGGILARNTKILFKKKYYQKFTNTFISF